MAVRRTIHKAPRSLDRRYDTMLVNRLASGEPQNPQPPQNPQKPQKPFTTSPNLRTPFNLYERRKEYVWNRCT